ncbi:MAG: hypothetical protein U9R47_05835, partial [Actinomycetota bacterium]|nr:hypothetical protein [Actinomycetota bacterium]
MSLPRNLAYLQDLATAEAKRRGHETVGVCHLAAAILKVEEEALVAEFGEDAASKVQMCLGPNGTAFHTPELTGEATGVLEAAAQNGGAFADVAREMAGKITDAPAAGAVEAPRSTVAAAASTDVAGIVEHEESVADDAESRVDLEDLLEELDLLVGLGN